METLGPVDHIASSLGYQPRESPGPGKVTPAPVRELFEEDSSLKHFPVPPGGRHTKPCGIRRAGQWSCLLARPGRLHPAFHLFPASQSLITSPTPRSIRLPLMSRHHGSGQVLVCAGAWASQDDGTCQGGKDVCGLGGSHFHGMRRPGRPSGRCQEETGQCQE